MMTNDETAIKNQYKMLLSNYEKSKFELDSFVSEHKDILESKTYQKTRIPPKRNFASKRAEHMYYDLKVGDWVVVKTRKGVKALKVFELPEVDHVKCKVPEFTIFRYNLSIMKWIQTFIENKPEDQVVRDYSYNSITGKIFKNDKGKIEVKRYK